MNIGTDRTYFVYIDLSDDVVFSNGKRDILLPKQTYKETLINNYTKDTAYYGIFSNCVVSASGYHNEYVIDMKGGGSEFSASSMSERSFGIYFDMYFHNDGGVCRELNFRTMECKEFEAEVQKDYIRCYTDSSFGVDTRISFNLGYKEFYTEFLFKDVDFSIKSFEIRKKEDGKPMVYLDMDGDGVYEKDCSEYLDEFDYWEDWES